MKGGKKMEHKKSKSSEPELFNIPGNPLTAEEMVNKYGTYNIQPTADTENDFPKISQGLATERVKVKPIKKKQK